MELDGLKGVGGGAGRGWRGWLGWAVRPFSQSLTLLRYNRIAYLMNNKSQVQTAKLVEFPRPHPELSKISSQKTILESEDCEGSEAPREGENWQKGVQRQERGGEAGQGSGEGRGEARCEYWSVQQESLLLRLHNEKGNRWVEIAHALGKSDNAVKNHYHSKLRKGLRRINACIHLHLHSHKILKNNILSKIIQAAQETLALPPSQDRTEGVLAFDLKNAVLRVADLTEQQTQTQEEMHNIRKIVEDLTAFNRNYRKKPKNIALPKPTVSKYKGKEIKNLIEERQKEEEKQSESDEEQQEEVQQERQLSPAEPLQPQPTVTRPETQVQGFFVVNQPIMTLTPYYLPYYGQPKISINPTRQSSFSIYQPQNVSVGLNGLSWQNFPQMVASGTTWVSSPFLTHSL